MLTSRNQLIRAFIYLAGRGMPFAAYERLVKRSLCLQRFITRSRSLHGLGNKVSLGIKTFPSPRILHEKQAISPDNRDNLLHTICRFESESTINFSNICIIPTGNITIILLSLSLD